MSTPEPIVPHDPTPPAPQPAPAPAPGRRPGRFGPLVALGLALVAGLLGSLAGEVALERYFFGPTPEAARQQYDFRELNRQLGVAAPKNSAVAYGLLGLMLGGAMGVAGGLGRRAALGGVVGAVAGLAAGVAASFLFVPGFVRTFDRSDSGLGPVLVFRSLVAAAVGAAGGLAYGLGRGGRRNVILATIGGLIGAGAGAALVEMLSAIAFPLARNDQFLPTSWETRLAGRLFVCGLAALAAALAAPHSAPAKAASAAEV